MKTILLILTVLAAAVLTPFASADGLPVVGVVDPAEVGGQIRYEALLDERDTFVQRTESGTGTLLQSRILQGRFEIPVVAYDGSAGGLSANGQTLVLISPRVRFPRRQTTFAVLAARTLKVLRTLSLRGDYSFDALSPDGRWMYLIHYIARKDPRRYEVRVVDVRTGTLEPKPIVDPREPDEKMNGNPLTRTTSPEGRWAYTLYDGTEHPFVHALDTAGRDARCIDLDWLTGVKSLRALRFALRDEGRELIVRAPDGEHVAVVDTTTFEAARPSAAGIASWPKLGLSSLALLLAVAGLVYVVPRPLALGVPVEPPGLDQPRRRHLGVGVLDDPDELLPVDPAVEAHAQPAAMADVRRPEEALRVGLHEQLLDSVLGRAPDREAPDSVVIVEHHQEGTLVADEERRVTVAQALARLR